MLRRFFQLLTLAALVNLIYQYWPREGGRVSPVVNSRGYWGFVDENGRVLGDFEWNDVTQVGPEGDALVIKGRRSGIVDYRGKVLVEAKWDYVSPFSEIGLAEVSDGGRVGLVDRSGKLVTPVDWLWFDDSGVSKGFIICTGYQLKSGLIKKGLMDLEGKVVLDPVWDDVSPFGPQGIAPVKNNQGWGLINRDGKMVVKNQWEYTKIGSFGPNGLAMVAQRIRPQHYSMPVRRVGWIDVFGKMVIPMKWRSGRDFDSNGLAAVESEGRKWGWIDSTGREVLPPEWDEVTPFDEWGLARVKRGYQWGVINVKGEVVIPIGWQEIGPFDEEGLAMVTGDSLRRSEGSRSWLANVEGKMVEEYGWDKIGKFDAQGNAWVEVDGKCGLVDRKGNVRFLIPGMAPTYDSWKGFDRFDRAYFDQGSYIGEPRGKTGWINRDGEIIEIPMGWSVLGDKDWEGVYSMVRDREVGLIKRAAAKVKGWFGDRAAVETERECRCYDKDGNLIWSSTWLRKTTKAWLYLFAALLPMLIVLWMDRRKKKRLDEKS